MPNSVLTKKRPASLREARAQLAEANSMKVKKLPFAARTTSGVVVGEVEPQPAGTVSKGALPNPIRVGGISIRYVEPTAGPVDEEK